MISKLTCDLCEGALKEKTKGKGAICMVCGLHYPDARLQEKICALPPEPAPQEQTPLTNAFDFSGTAQDYFGEVFRREFSEYDVRENVRHRELTIPVNYMLCKGVYPALAIFLIPRADKAAAFQVEKATRIFAASGISCLHFYSDCRNDATYVIRVIRDALPKADAD